MIDVARKFGGPAQFLCHHLSSIPDKNGVTDWILDSFPEAPDVHYQHEYPVPIVTEVELAQTPPTVIHLAMFGFDTCCSLRPHSAEDVFF